MGFLNILIVAAVIRANVPSEPTKRLVKLYPAEVFFALVPVFIISPFAKTTVKPDTTVLIVPYLTAIVPDAEVEVKDLAGDDNHYAATVTSSLFEGKTKVNQHKMVYDALEGKMGGVLHALSLTTLTPKN